VEETRVVIPRKSVAVVGSRISFAVVIAFNFGDCRVVGSDHVSILFMLVTLLQVQSVPSLRQLLKSQSYNRLLYIALYIARLDALKKSEGRFTFDAI
jgi:hypothetical protein